MSGRYMMYAYAAGAEDLIPRLARFARGSDAKEFRKALLHSVRHERKEYDMSLCFFGPWTYACVKLARKYGMEVEPVKVVELLDWNFDETPIDRSQWKLPLQDDIDKWLK